jgi:hypothetical protein
MKKGSVSYLGGFRLWWIAISAFKTFPWRRTGIIIGMHLLWVLKLVVVLRCMSGLIALAQVRIDTWDSRALVRKRCCMRICVYIARMREGRRVHVHCMRMRMIIRSYVRVMVLGMTSWSMRVVETRHGMESVSHHLLKTREQKISFVSIILRTQTSMRCAHKAILRETESCAADRYEERALLLEN